MMTTLFVTSGIAAPIVAGIGIVIRYVVIIGGMIAARRVLRTSPLVPLSSSSCSESHSHLDLITKSINLVEIQRVSFYAFKFLFAHLPYLKNHVSYI